MAESERLSPGQISWLASLVADGTATPQQATSLVGEFVAQAGSGKIDPRLIEHARDCFAAFLAKEKLIYPSTSARRDKPITVKTKTLDKAFGTARLFRGQPTVDADSLIEAAAQLLEERLAGMPHQDALKAVAKARWGSTLPISSETQVGEAWAHNKRDALVWLRAERAFRGESWTEAEMDRLREIYIDVSGIVLSGERPFEGRHSLPD